MKFAGAGVGDTVCRVSADVSTEVTELLRRVSTGEGEQGQAWQRLLDLIYDELRRVAGALMAREQVGHTLQPTALVNEAYLRLVKQEQPDYAGREHFLAVAARCMRNVLVDHARAKRTAKRGGGLVITTIDIESAGERDRTFETLELHQALEKLAQLDERAARVCEMRLFGGMTMPEIAKALEVSNRTIDGDWASARLWLSRELSHSP